MGFLIKIAVNAVGLWVAGLLVSGITLGEGKFGSKFATIVLVAIVFGIINAVVKPIAKLLSFPFIILTLGLFTLVVNALMLQITSWLAGALHLDFHVDAFFWDAVLGALVITFVSLLLNILLPDGNDR